MSAPEDRIRRAAARAERSVPSIEVMERLTRRRRRYAIRRRTNVVLLSVVVIAVLSGQTAKLASPDELVSGQDPSAMLAEPGIGRPRVSPDGTQVVFDVGGGVPIDPDATTQTIDDT